MHANDSQETPIAPTIRAAQQTYTILRHIGAGGMGKVYQVTSPNHPEPIALKFLPASLTTESRIAAFKREFSLLAELHHPHVCRVFDFGFSSSHKQYFFTAEFVEGEDLFRALLQAPIDEVERVIVQALHALDFIHSVGLIHFDIKGDNILVSRKGGKLHATLVDFGISVHANEPTKEIAGTLYYMAPELLQPGGHFDHRVDLYAFGVVCYRLLAGIYPYEVETVEEARLWHQTQKLDLEPLQHRGVPDYLCQMVKTLMAPNAEERFSSAGVVLNYLQLHSPITKEEQTATQRATLFEGPLIGREGHMATVTNAIQRVVHAMSVDETIDQEEHPQSYLIVGDRGLGKSRLLKEIKYYAQIKDCATWLIDGEREGRDLHTFLAAFDIPPDQYATEPLSPDTAAQLLLDVARYRPTCYLIDNLDRAGPGVQKVILNLVGHLYSAMLGHDAPPLVVVIAETRSGVAPRQVTGTPILELIPLEKSEVHDYVRQLLGPREETTRIADAVWEFSQGIPFLMGEAARQYHQHHDLGELPHSIEELYARHIAQLTTDGRRVLECLAFARHPLTVDVLSMLCKGTSEQILQQLQSEGLVRYKSTEETYLPATGALAQIVIKDLSPQRRSVLADQLIAWMEEDPGFEARDIAPYIPYSADQQKGIPLLEAAAEEAQSLGEGDQAVEFLHQAAAIVATMPEAQETLLKTQRKIATLLLYQGKYQACEELLHQITARQQTPGIEELKLLGLVKRAERRPKEAGTFYEQALGQLPKDTSNPTYLFLLNERAQAHLEAGAVKEALDLYSQSHGWTKKLARNKQLKVTNNNLGVALARLGKVDEALQFYQEKLDVHGHEKRIAASIHGQMGVIYLHAGRTDEALSAFLQAWEQSSAIGDSHNALTLLDNIIALLQKRAIYSEALQYARRSFQIKAAGAPDIDLSRSLMTVATLYLNLGLPDLAARYLTQAMRLARKCRNHQLLGWIQITFGYLYKDLGRLMESLNAFEETIAIGESNNDEGLIRWGCYGAVDLLVEKGEIEEANTFFQRLSLLLANETDAEFRVRYEILRRKIEVVKHPQPDAATGPVLQELSQRCAQNDWRELHWEIEYLLGVFHEKRDEIDAALTHLGEADTIIMKIANGLGEEYKSSYLRQLSRAKVRADLRSLLRQTGQLGTAGASQREQPTTAVPQPMATSPLKTASPSPGNEANASVGFAPNVPLATYEKELLVAALAHYHGDLEQVATSLHIPLAELLVKLREHHLTDFDPDPVQNSEGASQK